MTTERYSIAIIIPNEHQNALGAIQKKYHLPLWEPSIALHITLVSPFNTPASLDEIIAILKPVAENRTAFNIKTDGLGRFDNDESVICLKVTSDEPLKKLAEDASTAVQTWRSPRTHPFTPHITLAAAASRETIDSYMERLASEKLQLEFICDRFALLHLDQKSRVWNAVKEFAFGNPE